MKTTITENEKGQIVYTQTPDGTETWYEDGLCVKFKCADGYQVKYTYDMKARTIIKVEDNRGLSEDFLANTL